MKAVLQNNLRLIRNGDGREELFDFANDRTDSHDLAAEPEHQADLEDAPRDARRHGCVAQPATAPSAR